MNIISNDTALSELAKQAYLAALVMYNPSIALLPSWLMKLTGGWGYPKNDLRERTKVER